MADFSYIGVGKVFMREAGAAAAMLEVGNCSALSGNITEDVKELKDYTQQGGGTYNEVRRVESVELTATMHDFSAENLARALFGSSSAISVTPIVDESHTAYVGGFIPTNYPAAGAIVVKEGMATLAEDTDYTLTPGGIIVKAGGALADGNTALLSYTPAAGKEVQALIASAKEYEIFFSGLNEARSGKAVTFHGFRWKMGAAQALALIGDDYGALEVTGKLMKDTTKNGVSVSQYFKVQIIT